MKVERLEILKMVADKVISVEEGERLLAALEKNQAHGETADAGFGKKHRQSSPWRDLFSGWGTPFSWGMADFLKPFRGDPSAGYDKVSLTSEGFKTGTGEQLLITRPTPPFDSTVADVELISSPAEFLRAEGKNLDGFQLLRKGNQLVLLCREGIRLQVPDRLSRLELRWLKGTVKVQRILLPLEIKNVTGDIFLTGLAAPLTCHTFSGDIEISVTENHQGQSTLHTFSGDIRVQVPQSFSGKIEARTLNGTIKWEGGLAAGVAVSKWGFGSETAKMGSGNERNHLQLSTFNGNIRIATS